MALELLECAVRGIKLLIVDKGYAGRGLASAAAALGVTVVRPCASTHR